ncbi:MAG: protein kinase domain-containing protein [Candidatus Dormibacteraceae bacterium]
MRFAAGIKLGPYEIVERIGRGGMATVYRAYHRGLDRQVAVKVLSDTFADDEEFLERFMLEARSVARLKHPNILVVFDFDQVQETPYLVMELVEGGTLSQRLGGPIDLRETVRLLGPVASALDYAHSHGIVHRDIKPSNILIHKDGTPVVADFGLAKLADSVRNLTSSRFVLGTPDYMSPEQSSGGHIGPASDRYSLAIVAYEMLTGRVPFQASTPAGVLLSHISDAPPPALELHGELSAHVDSALQRALAKRPEDRFASSVDFVAALTPAAWPSTLHEDAEDARPAFQIAAATRRKLSDVLVVDDSQANRELIAACLSGVDCDVRTAEDGPSALAAMQVRAPDLVLLDVQMPGIDGYEVCRRIKRNPSWQLVPVVMITALDRTADRVEALEAGADDYMSKPVERVELVARVRSALRLKAVYDSLDSAERVIFALANAVEARDPHTEAHVQRVASSARRLGERLGLAERALDTLYRGGLIHDIGKIGIPDSILLKAGALDEDESCEMRRHTEIGAEIVSPLRTGEELVPIIRHHHEHFDGSGYPDGLSGDDIPLAARIVAVCDAYDAMVSDRPYRPGLPSAEAINRLVAGSGRQWDAAVVAALLAVIKAGHRGVA